MASLTGQPVNTTYEALIKFGDNAPVTDSEKVLSDGDGTSLPIEISTSTVNITGTLNTTSGIINVATPTANSHAATKLYVDNAVSGAGAVTSVNGEVGDVEVLFIRETVKNVSGAIMYRGTPVHVTGAIGSQAEVIAADATTNHPAHYILDEDINSGASGFAIAIGLITDVDLTPFGLSASSFSEGDEVYLGSTGGFTTTRPTGGTTAVQLIGVILKVNVSGNQISGYINGMGRVNSSPNLPYNHVFVGNVSGNPITVNQNTLSVASAVTASSATTSTTSAYADEAADVKIDAVTSGTYRVIVGDTGLASGAYQRLKSDVSDGFTFNTTGDVLTAGEIVASVGNVEAANALVGNSLDIAANADIDGTLTLGGIGDVETSINDLETDVAALQAIPQFAPIVTETATITISDDSYDNKFIVFSGGASFDIEIDSISNWEPALGTEIYFMNTSGDVSIVPLGPTVLTPPGKNETTSGTNAVAGIKCIAEGVAPSIEATWVIMGDLS